MRAPMALLAALVLSAAVSTPHAQARRTLDIYVVDVEGGNATLFVAPTGGSVLIDSGNPGPAAARDADRIVAAAKDAGLSRIDHLITTHWHADHFGAMAELGKRMPIGNFIDHGPNTQPAAATDDFLKTVYPALHGAATHQMVKAGDRVAVDGLDWRIVSAGRRDGQSPVARRGQGEPVLRRAKPRDPDPTENAQSVGSVATFGRFRVAHLGDLTWNKELDLMCPTNRIGTVDLFVVSHHGQASSNSPALVHAIESRVALINNGTRKGGAAGRHARAVHRTGTRRPVADPLFAAERPGVHGPWAFIANAVDEPPAAIAVTPMPPPQPGAPPAAAAQRHGTLAEGLRGARRDVHRHQRPERVQQDLPHAAEITFDPMTELPLGERPCEGVRELVQRPFPHLVLKTMTLKARPRVRIAGRGGRVQRSFAGMLLPLLMFPTPVAFAEQQAAENVSGTGRPLLAAALSEAARLGRTGDDASTVTRQSEFVGARTPLSQPAQGVVPGSNALSLLTVGSRVRVRPRTLRDKVSGKVVALDNNVLTLDGVGGPLKVSVDSIEDLELSLGRKRHWLKGLVAGALAGAGLGFAYPVDPQDCHRASSENFCSRGEAVGGAAMVFGGIGAGIGALVRTERWLAFDAAALAHAAIKKAERPAEPPETAPVAPQQQAQNQGRRRMEISASYQMVGDASLGGWGIVPRRVRDKDGTSTSRSQ